MRLHLATLRIMNETDKITVAALLNNLQQTIEQHLQQSIAVYQNLAEDELNRRADHGGWSIAQCLEHLNSYGRYYLPLIANALKKDPAQPIAMVKRSWLGRYFINMIDPDGKLAKYKAAKIHLPVTTLTAHQVVAEFIAQQEKMISLLEDAAYADLNQIRIPISIARLIRLRLGDLFTFLIMHNERHIRQANRNLKA